MKKITFITVSFLLIFVLQIHAQRRMEKLNRGLIAVKTSSTQTFLSWRILGSDPDNIAFNLYRDEVKITDSPVTGASNYTDNSTSATTYTVKTVINGVETGEQNSVTPWSTNYWDIPMNIPTDMTMPDGSTCSYSPNDCSTGDADGDGELEIFVKWDPSNSKDNSNSGYTGDVFIDVYKLNGTQLCRIDLGKNIRAGAHYTQFQVADFDGDGKAEIICKTAPGAKDGKGNYLSKGPAATDNDAADYRNSSGRILSGPEYLTVFSGLTGEELATTNYIPARGTVSSWGDSYGNRVDRFLAGTAYLDGLHPSAIMCRGYYTRAVVAAWNYRDGNLTNVWTYDSGTTSGVGLYGQGNHNMSIGDVDDDGKDEIIWGSGAVDDDGKLLYRTGLGHGDAMHLSDLNPERKGLEVWEVHEESGSAYGEEMHDAKTGAILFGTFTGDDNGRGLAANVTAGNYGFEMWSAHGAGVFSKSGSVLYTSKPSMNFRIYWDGDLQDELLDGTIISKYMGETLMTADGCLSNNYTKATPNISADILGDWREEVIFRTSDNTKLRIFTTTIPTGYKLYTLMHDAVYRAGVAWENTGYNQPPHAGFYMGDDMDTAPVSPVYDNELSWTSGTKWDLNTTASWTDSLGNTAKFKNGEKVLFDISAGTDADISLSGTLLPIRIKVNSPYNVTLSGTGKLSGTADLKKNGAGILTLNTENNFTGNTTVWDGALYNNGTIASANVYIQPFATLGGKGIFTGNVSLTARTNVIVGESAGTSSKMTINGSLSEKGSVNYYFDIMINNGVIVSNDTLSIGGDWNLNTSSVINLNTINGTISTGDYTLLQCKGSVSGDITKLKVSGVPSYLGYRFVKENENIILRISAPAFLVWEGNVDGNWDNGKTANWKLDNVAKTFASNDSVIFNNNSLLKNIAINEAVNPASVVIESSSTYSFSGNGQIAGTGRLVKNGTGKITISNSNTYTGKTIINEGTVEFQKMANGGIASPIGAASNSSSNIVLNGGKLSLTGATQSTDRGITLGENGGSISISNSATVLTMSGKITGTGRLIKEGSGRLALSASNDFQGGTTIKSGSILLTSDAANVSGIGTSDTITLAGGALIMYNSTGTDNTSNWNIKVPEKYTGTLNVDGKSLITGTITGGGTLNYFSGYTANILASDVSAFYGTLNVTTDADGGLLALYNTKGYTNAKINLYNKVTMLYRVTANITIPVGDLAGMANSELGAGGTGPCTINWQVGSRGSNSAFNGKITDSQYSGSGAKAAITKVGTGVWTLTNDNTFSGGTSIDEGTIMVNNTSGSGLGTGIVSVNATGILAGSGSIAGAVSVDEGGALSPGNGIGTLTFNNDISILSGGILAIDIDKTNATNDLLTTSGTLNMNGILEVNATEGTVFAIGDAFKIIDGTINGTPAEISPAIPSDGLEWDLSEFASNGILKVKQATGIINPEIGSDVYPNPFRNTLNIKIDNAIDDLKISVYNLLGSEIYSQMYEGQTQIILNTEALPKGIYMLRLQSGDKITTRKIVKE
ncbi:MAG: autotransporter-associated beta strand repeat-containing protein [Paludibacter sp.]|nr:autotransporter-associated beta strand repeat-containing protein [Paludibacter sp.]